MAIHERVWEKEQQGGPWFNRPPSAQAAPVWTPRGTYGLLIAIVVVYVLQVLTYQSSGIVLHHYLFAINPTWYLNPWTLVTSTLSHSLSGLGHLLFNGLFLWFFGPQAERILGTRKFVSLFLIAGAVSGVCQVLLQPGFALGASGALMMLFGTLMILMPHQQILVYGIIPIKFWVAGILYALLDVVGALNPNDGIGNFAHLSGMALGLLLGKMTKDQLARRGMHVAY